MRTTKKIIAVLAVAGVAALVGTAATGNGVTSNVATNQFIGGSLQQSVIGAVIDTATVTRTGNHIDTFVLTFTNANVDGKTVTLTTTGGTTDTYTCEAIGTTTTKVSTCTEDATGSAGITSYTVTVA